MTAAVAVVEEKQQEIKQEALTIVERAKGIVISDQVTYDEACNLLNEQIKPFRKRWKEFWEPLREPAERAYKAILAKREEGDTPLESAEKKLKAAILKWEQDQERIRQEAQRKAQRDAEEKEEAERAQAAFLAEQDGLPEEQVQAIAEAPLRVVAPVVEPTYERARGISVRENYKCRVTDLKALCKAIGAGKVPITYVEPNMSVLNARAKADKETMQVPGCESYNDAILAGRGR